jgi:acyl-CoA synthetase (AMP-forming)/AMP-acid ligase II
MSKLDDLIAEVSVTRRLVSVAAGRGDLAALIGGAWSGGCPDSDTCSYSAFAATVQAVAAGLAWRGLRPGDVVGVIVPDATTFALGVHAVRAAGGVPSPVDVGLCAAETASQLAESGARMIITAPEFAVASLAAADRSWVRQVFSFGDAPNVTRFADLLGFDTIRPSRGRPDDVALLPFRRDQDSRLRPAPVTHAELARMLGDPGRLAEIACGDVVLATPPAADGLAYALLIDDALLRGATIVATPASELAATAAARHAVAAIAPPAMAADVPASVRLLPVG